MNSIIKNLRVSQRGVNQKIFVLVEASLGELNPLEGLKLLFIILPFYIGCAKDAPNEGFDLYPHVDVIEYNEVEEIKNTDTNSTTFKYSNATAATLEPDTTKNEILISEVVTISAKAKENNGVIDVNSALAKKTNTATNSKNNVLQTRRAVPASPKTKDTTKVKVQSETSSTVNNSAKAKKTPQNNQKSVKEEQKSINNETIYSVKKPVKTAENRAFSPKNAPENRISKTDSVKSVQTQNTKQETESTAETKATTDSNIYSDNLRRVQKSVIDSTKSVAKVSKSQSQPETRKIIITDSSNAGDIKLTPLHKQDTYETGKKHTLVIDVVNMGSDVSGLNFDVRLPNTWNLISASTINTMQNGEKRLALISFFIPAKYKSGSTSAQVNLITDKGSLLGSSPVTFKVAKNFGIEVFNVFAPQNVQAGETIKASYFIKNTGNVNQKIALSSRNSIEGNEMINLAADSIIVVDVTQKTTKKVFALRTMITNLKVESAASGEAYQSFSKTDVFPARIKQTDPFKRFPIEASLLYNSYTNEEEHYSTVSAELRGHGFLDSQKKHHLNFTLRGPKQINLKRFGVIDQYSALYNYDNKTIVHLGDHTYRFNYLGFNSRYGMGARIDHRVKNWMLSAFYTKPRLYDFNDEPLYGVKAQYHFTDSLQVGVSVARSSGTEQGAYFNIPGNENEEGQITTFNFKYVNNKTLINAESSFSLTNENVDYANYINLIQRFENLTYSGNFTIAGENYFGALRNSLQYSNNLRYRLHKWNFTLGQNMSKINERLNPLFFAAAPYYEDYYGGLGYRPNQRHYVSIRLDRRVREDQLKPRNYYYKEYGLNYRYAFTSRDFSLRFNGRIAETKNLLAATNVYRKTYAHTLQSSYRIYDRLTFKGSLNHNYNNRYGKSDFNTNYFRYSLGVDYSLSRMFRFDFNYNSGFSPEDSYMKRDFINASLMAQINKNHRFELRANYYENAGNTTQKELLGFGKYTYMFGIPLRRTIEQGGLKGYVFAADETIKTKGIRIVSSGKTLSTNAKGEFELNNLPLGTNYIFIDESSLPLGIVAAKRAPFKVIVARDNMSSLDIPLVRSSTINGSIDFIEKDLTKKDLTAYIKLENKEFTYTIESDKTGTFSFQEIVPGTYKIEIMRFKAGDLFDIPKATQITVEENARETISIEVGSKKRKIKFDNKNFKVGN
ncbi:hypothetical protein ACH3O9_01170 [Leeuwenhoekiella sp. A16]|uniref:hypothetical protein n=1 Tax=unclassified Leeuwenhoekiella TaxID=2615029 RepID=UPI003A813203